MLSKIAGVLNSKSESFYHKMIKQHIYESILKWNDNIVNGTLEKYFKIRRADMFFEMVDDKRLVIEIQHSKITIKEIIQRSKHYNQMGIYILWILHGNGKIVAETRIPENRKNVIISSPEKFLHRMYGGRVYYINIKKSRGDSLVNFPFALHYSLSDKKSKRRSFRKKYSYFYYRNANYTIIPNWHLLCVDFNGFKIARFYDKNIKTVLKNNIFNYIQENQSISQMNLQNYRNMKKLSKKIHKKFHKSFGHSIIDECIYLLRKKLEFNRKFIQKMQKKRNFK
jgi:hypothetical protein